MDKQRIIDSSSRDKIIHNTNTNYFVEAGAGSGKTTVLVERMVAMIEEGKNIEHICAITFTKAAANEFYARFQKRLIERSNAPTEDNFISSPIKLNNPDDTTRNNCKKALENIDLAFMGTIDAFCNMVMSEHPTLGKIPPNSSLIDEDEADSLYLREYTNILNGRYNNKTLENKAKLFINYNSKDKDAFVTVLKFLLNKRNCQIVIPKKVIENLDDKYADEKKTIKTIVEKLIEHPEFIKSSNEDNADVLRKNFRKYLYTFSRSWTNNITNLLIAYKKTFGDKNFRLYLDETLEKTLGSGMRYFEVHTSRNKPVWYEINDELKNIFSEIESERYQVTLDFVNDAKDIILQKLRNEGKLTFNDYLVYLRDTLKQDAQKEGKLIRHIFERHKYFMIDEFQDTDPIQSEIFFYLAAKDIKPDWKKCLPHEGSLFIVGDPKQSIYRFKNADVSAFLNIKKMFENKEIGEVLNLYCNFRSTYQIRSWFNKTFINLMEDSQDQSAYPLIPTSETELNDDFSGIYSYAKPKGDDGFDEYNYIAKTILKLIDNPKYQITAKEFIDGKEVKIKRNLKWKDFMIITPTKTKLADFTSALRNYSIPYFVEGNIKFKECPALITLSKIYHAIVLIEDNRFLYDALKSDYFQISDLEIFELKENKVFLNLDIETEELFISDNLKRALDSLKDLAKLKDLLNPSSLLKKLVEEYDIFHKTGNKNMEYLYFVLEQIKTKESNKEIISHTQCVNYIDDLLEEKIKLERCPGFKKDGNQVHLANLHKVKGLEAPVVILGSPSSGNKSADFRMVRNDQNNLGYVFKIPKGSDSFGNWIETSDYQEYVELEKNSIEAEKIRLAYVAATRARNVLIISSNPTSKGESATNPWKYLLNDTLSLEIKLKDEKIKENIKSSHDLNNQEEKVFSLDENLLTPTYKNISPSLLSDNYSSSYIEDDEDDCLLKQIDEQNDKEATLIGTLVHRLMELIIISKDAFKKEELVKHVVSEYINSLDDELILKFEKTLNEVYEKMHNGGYKQENGLKEDILNVLLNAEEVKCEIPFNYRKDNELYNGFIDLVYKDLDGYHIIDWKTNKGETDLDKHYAKQLNAYKDAFKRCVGEEVLDAKIYHIKIK